MSRYKRCAQKGIYFFMHIAHYKLYKNKIEWLYFRKRLQKYNLKGWSVLW